MRRGENRRVGKRVFRKTASSINTKNLTPKRSLRGGTYL